MKDGGGAVIDRAKVVLILLGPGCLSGILDTSTVKQVFSAILASPYASELVQYRGIRRPTLVDTIIVTSTIGHLGPDPGGFLTTQVLLIDTSEIVATVKNARKVGHKEPIDDSDLYLVSIFGDSLSIFSEQRYNNAFGFHDQFQDDDGKIVRYGVSLTWTGSPVASIWNSNGGLPAVLTHEMVEACTDPDGLTGFRLDDGNEIGDINDVRGVQLPGITQTIGLAAYWSDLRNIGVVPRFYSTRITFDLRSSDTSTFSDPISVSWRRCEPDLSLRNYCCRRVSLA